MRGILSLTLWISLCIGPVVADEEVARPNVLMIAIDDLNDWVGCMGGHPNAKTPHIERIANEGVTFMNNH